MKPSITNEYLIEFFQSNSCADLFPLFSNYKNSKIRNKEITESMACLYAARVYSGFDPKDDSVNVFVIGDGIRPRTGMIISYFTSWYVISIDPLLNNEWFSKYWDFKLQEGMPIKRFQQQNKRIEECGPFNNMLGPKKSIIILPHSHADMRTCLQKVEGKSTIINMPCCTRFSDRLRFKKAIEDHKYICYRDEHVLSPKNEVHIWQDMDYEDYKKLTKS